MDNGIQIHVGTINSPYDRRNPYSSLKAQNSLEGWLILELDLISSITVRGAWHFGRNYWKIWYTNKEFVFNLNNKKRNYRMVIQNKVSSFFTTQIIFQSTDISLPPDNFFVVFLENWVFQSVAFYLRFMLWALLFLL